MHHIKQWGTAIQIEEFRCLPNFPCQQANSSTTVFGITQWVPNKVNTIDHKSKAIGQWIRRWSTNSPFLLHKLQQYKISPISLTHTTPIQNQNLLFPKIISGQNIPQSYSPNKKSNSRRDLRLPNSLPRERLIETLSEPSNKNKQQNLFP